MKKLFSVIGLVVVCFYLAGCCDPEIAGTVPNNLRPQETGNWCWAAVTQMLAEHVGISVAQCDLANHRFGRSDCCNNQNPGSDCPKTNTCNIPGWPMLDYAGVKFEETSTARCWDQVRSQIYCGKKPMGYAYGIPDKVGHVVVIKGYITVAGTDYVILNDPWAPCNGTERLLEYSSYADPPGDATHWNTWYNIAKK